MTGDAARVVESTDEPVEAAAISLRCSDCGACIDRFDDAAWRSLEDFGGTGSGAYTETLWCTEAADHKHSPVSVPESPGSAVPQPVDREALYALLRTTRVTVTDEWVLTPSSAADISDAVLAMLSGSES